MGVQNLPANVGEVRDAVLDPLGWGRSLEEELATHPALPKSLDQRSLAIHSVGSGKSLAQLSN